jgi:hypothetical protein
MCLHHPANDKLVSMFNETLTLNDGAADQVYSTVVTGDYKRIRRVPSSDLNTPKLLTISHQLLEQGNLSRSLVRLDRTIEDAAGVRGVVSLQYVIVIPRNLAVEADVQKLVTQGAAFWATSGYVGKIVNLES